MSDKGLSEKYLEELRSACTTGEFTDTAVIVELLDEVDALDDALHASEDEVERLRATVRRLRARVEPRAVSGSVRKLPSGRWQARWRDTDGMQYARSFDLKADARCFLAEAEAAARRSGGVL
ncbi:hypothetical protein ACGF0D_10460 [Kitasatospora sp. NPDC048298]|uniref:hypothetical protein n=1 Tax=Kitasatospora sp. NPDC048298 TaxID=3364049 RepID=UPI003723E3C7